MLTDVGSQASESQGVGQGVSGSEDERRVIRQEISVLDNGQVLAALAQELRQNPDADTMRYEELTGEIAERDWNVFVPMMPALFHDKSSAVLGCAYTVYGQKMSVSTDIQTRQSATEILSASLRDWLSSTESPDLRSDALGYIRTALSGFGASADFADISRKHLEEAFSLCMSEKGDQEEVIRFLIQICGVAGMEMAKPYLARVVEADRENWTHGDTAYDKWSYTMTWQAMRASARIYESSDIYACLAVVKQHASSPEQLLKYAEELTYIRRPQIAEFLLPFTADSVVYPEHNGDLRMPYHSRAEHAAALILKMMPAVREDACTEIRQMAEQRGGSLSRDEQAAIYIKYATNRENWKRIER